MAIDFTIAKRGPLPTEDGDVKDLYPRLRSRETVDVVDFQKNAPWGTAMTPSNLIFALGELQRIMLHELREGKAVTLPGIGTFRLSLRGDIEIREGCYHGRNVRVDGLIFQPDRELRDAVSRFAVNQTPYGTAIQADRNQVEEVFSTLFREKESITHKNVFMAFEGVLTRHRVTSLLRRLVHEGRLLREGEGSQTRYRAVKGQFGQ